MTAQLDAVAAIAGVALVTYALRCCGLWIARRVTVTRRADRVLRQLPPTLLISIIAPMVASGGTAYVFATAAATLVAMKSNSVVATMGVGIATVVLLRS